MARDLLRCIQATEAPFLPLALSEGEFMSLLGQSDFKNAKRLRGHDAFAQFQFAS